MYGTEIIKRIVERYKDKLILVYFDPDPDGVFAGKLVCDFLDSWNYKYTYYMNDNRSHGFFLNPEDYEGGLIIAVDFGVTREEVQKIVDSGVSFIMMDHHEIEEDFIHIVSEDGKNEGVVINNQYPFEPEEDRYLSGAGVVYETLSEIEPSFATKVHEAVVGITLLSDIRPIENPKARAYLKTTYKIDTDEPYIDYLITETMKSDFGFGKPKLDRNFIDYTLSPTINSLLRFNFTFQAIDFVFGRGTPKADLKAKQRALIRYMETKSKKLDMENGLFVALNAEDFDDLDNVKITNFIGYLCSDLKGVGKSTFVFVMDKGKVSRASFRGQFDTLDYRGGFESLGLDARGHKASFGVLEFKPYRELWGMLDSLIGDLNRGYEETRKVLPASNLSMIVNNRGYKIAEENCYTRDMYRTYIRYTGNNMKIARESEKYIEYIIDGKKVKCFTKGLDKNNSVIMPILEKGYVQLYLREMDI